MSDTSLLLRRIVAACIDAFIVVGGLALVWRFQPYATPDETGNYGCAGCVLFLLSLMVYLAYFAIGESNFGRTLGKAVAGIKVVSADGRPPDAEACIQRHLLDLVDFQFLGLPAIIAVLTTPKHQRLGDLWAGTVVVRDEAPR